MNDVFKANSGGTALQKALKSLFHNHDQGHGPRLEFADMTLDVVTRNKFKERVVVKLQDGSEYDFGEPDALLDLKPHKIAVVKIEDGGAGTKGVCRVLASVEDPKEPGTRGPASCFSYDLKT